MKEGCRRNRLVSDTGGEGLMGNEREHMRKALRRIATNVSIISTRDGDVLHGMTANAWSEGTEPPIVLVTLNRRSETYKRVKSSGVFAASLLSEAQKDLALRFARPGKQEKAFQDVAYRVEATGSPILEGCVAFFDCRVEGFYPFGNYDIVTGEAQACGPGSSDKPLIYYDARLTGLASEKTVQVPAEVDEQRQ
jgi:flavin reductase (DIM6/NTAB) family NADH-FMN oxidoreductase RutF